MRSIVLSALFLAPAPALAGGFGLLVGGGFHADRVYSYTKEANESYTRNDPETQFNMNGGGGFEIVLGDRDNSVLGIFRGTYVTDAAQSVPEADDSENTFSNVRTTTRAIGEASAGLQWGVLGESDGKQLTVLTNLGSGLFTTDLTEYVKADVGVGGTWMLTSEVQLQGSVNGGFRYRKAFYPTVDATVGVRYLFD